MKAYRRSRGTAPLILNSALHGGERLNSRSERFTPGMKHGAYITGCLMGPQACLNVLEYRRFSFKNRSILIQCVLSIVSPSTTAFTSCLGLCRIFVRYTYHFQKQDKIYVLYVPPIYALFFNAVSAITNPPKSHRHLYPIPYVLRAPASSSFLSP
jgi:hypothetical protein